MLLPFVTPHISSLPEKLCSRLLWLLLSRPSLCDAAVCVDAVVQLLLRIDPWTRPLHRRRGRLASEVDTGTHVAAVTCVEWLRVVLQHRPPHTASHDVLQRYMRYVLDKALANWGVDLSLTLPLLDTYPDVFTPLLLQSMRLSERHRTLLGRFLRPYIPLPLSAEIMSDQLWHYWTHDNDARYKEVEFTCDPCTVACGVPVLSHALLMADYKTALDLIEQGADVNARSYNGRTPLHYLLVGCQRARSRDLDARRVLRRLLYLNADAAAVDDSGNTPLHVACGRAFAQSTTGTHSVTPRAVLSELLAARGAEATSRARNCEGLTPREVAVACGATDLLDLLCDDDSAAVPTEVIPPQQLISDRAKMIDSVIVNRDVESMVVLSPYGVCLVACAVLGAFGDLSGDV